MDSLDLAGFFHSSHLLCPHIHRELVGPAWWNTAGWTPSVVSLCHCNGGQHLGQSCGRLPSHARSYWSWWQCISLEIASHTGSQGGESRISQYRRWISCWCQWAGWWMVCHRHPNRQWLPCTSQWCDWATERFRIGLVCPRQHAWLCPPASAGRQHHWYRQI